MRAVLQNLMLAKVPRYMVYWKLNLVQTWEYSKYMIFPVSVKLCWTLYTSSASSHKGLGELLLSVWLASFLLLKFDQ